MTKRTETDLIITGGIVLTMDEPEVIEPGAVVVNDGDIVFVGTAPDAAELFIAPTVIDTVDCVVIPGLVNGHTHAAMSLLRGIADDLPLEEWLQDYIFPAEARNLDEDLVYWGTKLACAEMLLGGITTFCDMYLFEDSAARAARDMGMRGVMGEVLYDFDSPNYGTIEKGFEYTETFIQTWKDDPLITPSVQPHALDTCSPELLVRAKEIADSHKVPLIVHVAETKSNREYIKEKHSASSFVYLDKLGVLGENFVADHAVWVDDEEMDIMADRGVSIVTNPESNMKLSSGWAPIHSYLQRGITVGLGTDGAASNNNLDMMGEMDTLAKLHKVYDTDPTHLGAKTVMGLATRDGARALGLGEITGSLTVGKKADIAILDFNKPHLTPMYDPFSHIVYAALASDVRDVVVGGVPRVRGRRLVNTDIDQIMANAKQLAGHVRSSLK